ncbi:hypothetical protein [Vibrio europaeus]|uniref:hypothetical protein n=1 Tax=Vibrio europaeus TaxID=300876 RepID=UPI00233E91ED|nr:hypothetical protein [Vibrio europaeus]MDC5753621.1 hypothetical protein [Vibrio europaeus]MDC5816572.1 hypothetical protein [Vibrio europaeus]
MTPAKLLESVKARFSVLLNNDVNQFNEFLKQALSTYESKAGHWREALLETGETPLPEDFQQKVTCRDRRGYHVRVRLDTVNKKVIIENADRLSLPCSFFYYVNLRDVDLDTYELPHECVRLVSDYLYVLIAIPEFERQARIAASNGYDTSVYPSQDSLQTQKNDLEIAMTNQMVMPNVKVR